MRYIYDEDKNKWLKEQRGIGFEDIIELLENSGPLTILDHHNLLKYPSQRIFVIEIDDYVWEVPYLKNDEGIILKTAYPSRRSTQKFLRIRGVS